MSYVEQMYSYLVCNSDKYDYKTIEYTKVLVEKIETEKGIIYDFFRENNIPFNRFLEETMLLAEYRLKNFGKADLSRADFNEVLDFLTIEIDIDKLIKNGHVELYEEEDDQSKIYIPDQFAVDFMKEKYDVDLELKKPFDYNLFYEKPPDDGLIDLLDKICLN